MLFDSIQATDRDSVGENLNISCISKAQAADVGDDHMFDDVMQTPVVDSCAKYDAYF